MNEKEVQKILFNDIVTNVLLALVVPAVLFVLYINHVILLGTLKLGLLIFFIVFVIGPLIYKHSYGLQKNLVFLNFVNLPKNPNYSNPAAYGLPYSRNFYVTTDEDIRLGVWQILPQKYVVESSQYNDDDYDNILRNSGNIILYSHGNSGNRVAPHRVELYKVLRKNFHVIAFDYRSYGDSSNVDPSELNLVKDCMFMYQWIRGRTSGNIFVWGHSLGTSITTHTLSLLGNDGIRPAGLFLEAPFTNLREEISEYPLTILFRKLPWFMYTIVNPMHENNLKFETDVYIQGVNSPIMILHAEDDLVVPYKLGRKLYKRAVENRDHCQGSVQFYGFSKKFRFGHKNIYMSPELPHIIWNFIDDCLKESERICLPKKSISA